MVVLRDRGNPDRVALALHETRPHAAAEPLRGLQKLPAIGLEELNASAALQDRMDVKYVVTLAQLDALLEQVAPRCRALEIDGRRAFAYRTTYYDTSDLLTFREHVQRRRRRFKCRKRRYVDSGRAVFEVKLKAVRGRTVKHAMPCTPADDLAAAEAAFLRLQLREAYGRELQRSLRPVLTATCLRSTIVAPALGQRLTCDVGLDFGGGRLADGLAIVESKSSCGRAAFDRLLVGLGARPVTGCSKYLLGMALTRDGVRDNDVRPLLRRYFTRASAGSAASRGAASRTWTSTRVTSRT
jgi:hypothetical protein